MEERIYKVKIELTDAELGVIMRGLNMFSDMDINHYLSDEQYEAAQSALSKLEDCIY